MFRRLARPAGFALAFLLGLGFAAGAQEPTRLTSMRTWTSPTGTRVVFDFSEPVALVAPDTGSTTTLAIAVPHAGIQRGNEVPLGFSVRDSAVDSVRADFDSSGVRLLLSLAEGTSFHVFSLQPQEDKPFRIVVDVTRASALAAEQQRLATLAALASDKRRNRTRLIVVDPGHGGEDAGAHGRGGIREKDVTLAIGLKVAAELNKVPGLRAVLTREGDFFIPLRERYQIAEKARADLFMSIHCNSTPRVGSGSGTEVYFLSLKGANDQAAADLADTENAADLVGGVPAQAEDDVVNVLYDVKRNGALIKSQLLAETLLDHVTEDRRIQARGIKQAGFVVLKSVEFPSVLVETAFINNPREAGMLRDPQFQANMARQLTAGVKDYFSRLGVTLGADSTATPDAGR